MIYQYTVYKYDYKTDVWVRFLVCALFSINITGNMNETCEMSRGMKHLK